VTLRVSPMGMLTHKSLISKVIILEFSCSFIFTSH
jgi:hypothetical protein